MTRRSTTAAAMLALALALTPGCARECRCVVRVSMDESGLVTVNARSEEGGEIEDEAEGQHDTSEREEDGAAVLDALATVGKAALNAALSLIF